MSGCDRFVWERVVRRLRLGKTTKATAQAVVQYGDSDGTNIRPSVARLARVTELSERSVRQGLAELRGHGLLNRVRRGGNRNTFAAVDAYELALPMDVFRRLAHLDPDEQFVCSGCADGVCQPAAPAGSPPVIHRVNRQPLPSEPAADAGEPAADDTSTGSPCHLPNQDHPLDQPRDQTVAGFHSRLTTARNPITSNVIPIGSRRTT